MREAGVVVESMPIPSLRIAGRNRGMRVDDKPAMTSDGGFIVSVELDLRPMWDSFERYGRYPAHPNRWRRLWTWVEVKVRTVLRCRRCGRSRRLRV